MKQRPLEHALVSILLILAGCAHDPAPPPLPPTSASPVASAAPARPKAGLETPSLRVSKDLADACKLDIGNAARAPKYEFDRSDLSEEDRTILNEIAKCVTTGKLKGRGLTLVGRTDPRGEAEYNLSLGARRSKAAASYLQADGVAKEQLVETSRGELDATGTDEAGWARDRRVDIGLR